MNAMNAITKKERRWLRRMLGTRHTRREATKGKGVMSPAGKLAKLVHAAATGQPVAFTEGGHNYVVNAAEIARRNAHAAWERRRREIYDLTLRAHDAMFHEDLRKGAQMELISELQKM